MQGWAWFSLHQLLQPHLIVVLGLLIKQGPVKTWLALYHSISLSITAGALWGIGFLGGRASKAQIRTRAFSEPIWTPPWPGFPNQNLQYNVRQLSFVPGHDDHHCFQYHNCWQEFGTTKVHIFSIIIAIISTMMLMVIVIVLRSWHEHLEHRCRMIKGFETWCGHDTLYLHLLHRCLHCICIMRTRPTLYGDVFAQEYNLQCNVFVPTWPQL